MRVDVVLLPSELKANQSDRRVVVVFDVLRATTTIAAALETGVEQILIFPDVESVRRAKLEYPGALSCGEQNCYRPEGFDLGNSPGDLGPAQVGKTLLMSTTNGTKAILAAKGAARILTGALVNARAAAKEVRQSSMDVTLLCAGTNGKLAMEDVIGAGALIGCLGDSVELESDAAIIARELSQSAAKDLASVLRLGEGGRNLIRAELEGDIEFAARRDVFTAVGEVEQGEPIRIVRAG